MTAVVENAIDIFGVANDAFGTVVGATGPAVVVEGGIICSFTAR